MYITIRKADDQCKLDAGSRARMPALWDKPEGEAGEGGGRGVQDGGTPVYSWLIHVDGENHHNTVK